MVVFVENRRRGLSLAAWLLLLLLAFWFVCSAGVPPPMLVSPATAAASVTVREAADLRDEVCGGHPGFCSRPPFELSAFSQILSVNEIL